MNTQAYHETNTKQLGKTYLIQRINIKQPLHVGHSEELKDLSPSSR